MIYEELNEAEISKDLIINNRRAILYGDRPFTLTNDLPKIILDI